jgi:hypothetical protein
MDIPKGPLNRIRLGAIGGQEEQLEATMAHENSLLTWRSQT